VKFLLVDISNSFTKAVVSDGRGLGQVERIATAELHADWLRGFVPDSAPDAVVFCGVVPSRAVVVREAFAAPVLELRAGEDLGVGIRYPRPEEIGPDRLANAVAVAELWGAPSIAVDFGTAVTFDVLNQAGEYIGGVIAPGLSFMTDYLHEKTALLPRIELREPQNAVGQSTVDAMLSGAVFGYRGLIREILQRIREEQFAGRRDVPVVATGGAAELIARGFDQFTAVDPLLTLHGLRLFALRKFPGAHQEVPTNRARNWEEVPA
jgi:type III pantothenate kinase